MFENLANLLVYQLGGLSPDSHLGAALHFFVMDTAKIFVMLVIIIYLMGLFRTLLRPETVREYIRGRSLVLARILAITLGAVTPFCSCSSVPLFIGFVEAGIPLGVTFSFLIASPMINEVAVVLLANIIGWQLTLLYVTAGLTVAYLGGAIMERFHPEQWVEPYVWKIQMGQFASPPIDTSLRGRHQFALGEVKDIVGRIWQWILIGIGAGALFHGYVPQEWAANLAGRNNFLAVPMAVLVGIPLYSNAIGVIPLAEAMLNKGVAMGTTLAFMMSIAAISLPELLILRKVIRWPGLLLFVAILMVAITLVGWTFNLLS
jgi:hypothetical protein